MTIDWNAFTPWHTLAGGLLIGAAAVFLMLLNGRIAGISGIVAGLLRPAAHDRGWWVASLAGMAASSWLYALFAMLPDANIDAGGGHWKAALFVAAMLVGMTIFEGLERRREESPDRA